MSDQKKKQGNRSRGNNRANLATAAALDRNVFSGQTVKEAIPADWHDRAKKGWEFYTEEPLVSNAINYTSKHKTIRLETAIEKQAVVIQVTDQGMGIAAEDLPHVFDRFYRTKEARKKLLTGTGLGLAITKEIVELHGGSISVSSEPGHGSTFTVQLPLPSVN